MTGGTGAELQTSRIKVAADYRYAVQETKNIAEATSLVCARPGDLPTARGEYAGQTRLPGTRMRAPSARLPAVLTKLAGCLRLVNVRMEGAVGRCAAATRNPHAHVRHMHAGDG